jgi:transcriptional regulator with XRE-family HTH domain
MIRSLNLRAFGEGLARAGLNQSQLAQRLGVSREAVSKWGKGESVPQPDKLLRLGTGLGLRFEELCVLPVPEAVPIVSFRRKAARKTRDEHVDKARETGELLKRLVPYLPEPRLTQAPVLKEPRRDYGYVQTVAADVRREMRLERKTVTDFKDLIEKFNRLHAVLVPALWGGQQNHGNALNIHLPDSGTTWVFLNLDSNGVDFKFWMAHELGHALAPTLAGEEAEDFADAFAQALLFPAEQADGLRTTLASLPGVGARVNRIREEARQHLISPLTIRRAIEGYEDAKGMERLDLGQEAPFMGAVRNFGKDFQTISEALFGKGVPEPKAYAASARKTFKSPFFEALAGYCKAEPDAEHFVHQTLGLPLADSKALCEALRG